MNVENWATISLLCLGFMVDTVLFVMIFLFFLTHLRFVLTNYTTIENLDRLRTNNQNPNPISVKKTNILCYFIIS